MKKLFWYTTLAVLLIISGNKHTEASQSSGTIKSGFNKTHVCHDVTCGNPTPGIINFKTTNSSFPITISDTSGIDGKAWGNELGWITFNKTGTSGVSIDPKTGILSGKAWAQRSGWVNFSVTGQQVAVNCKGEFEGWAWTGGVSGGWIPFNCSNSATCVKTDWRPTTCRAVPEIGKDLSKEEKVVQETKNLVEPIQQKVSPFPREDQSVLEMTTEPEIPLQITMQKVSIEQCVKAYPFIPKKIISGINLPLVSSRCETDSYSIALTVIALGIATRGIILSFLRRKIHN